MGTLYLPQDGSNPVRFRRASLHSGDEVGVRNEKWLQSLLFENPGLVSLDQMDNGAGDFVPLAREVPLTREDGLVFLDILGVSRSGRLVLIECKLWRNPQARREVIAQTLEYAALTRGLTYGDLVAKLLRGSNPSSLVNPIYDLARKHWPDLDESKFVDGVSRSLDLGDFYLIVAGDGIRSDLNVISDHLNASGLAAARFSLLEIQVWKDDQDNMLIIPWLPVRTEVIRQRVLLSELGRPLQIEDERDETGEIEEQVVDSVQAAARKANRAFWQTFIETARFDHPDQPLPRHGGNNWVRIPLPEPARSMTAFRTADKVGLFVVLSGETGWAFFEWLQGQADGARQSSGLDLRFDIDPAKPGSGRISVTATGTSTISEPALLDWLNNSANRLVTLLRSQISRWSEESL